MTAVRRCAVCGMERPVAEMAIGRVGREWLDYCAMRRESDRYITDCGDEILRRHDRAERVVEAARSRGQLELV
jgi:hypothetical protein